MSISLALLVAVFTLASPAAVGGERLPGGDMNKLFAGITLDGIYEDGSFFSETYFEDGTIRYHESDGADSGEWSVSGETFCTFYADQQGACFFVERDGANCFTFFEAIEDSNGKLVPHKTWTSRGWNRAADQTCPTPPEAEI